MLYSCTHMATAGVKVLIDCLMTTARRTCHDKSGKSKERITEPENEARKDDVPSERLDFIHLLCTVNPYLFRTHDIISNDWQ